ncbi:hypothetical protein [Bradyrhizobium glycinis]|nr:hypothetical protein [Bradyrhizobium glycinis]MBH5370698.1 hypothetical protein [Bradyrhizobium glycinis]
MSRCAALLQQLTMLDVEKYWKMLADNAQVIAASLARGPRYAAEEAC